MENDKIINVCKTGRKNYAEEEKFNRFKCSKSKRTRKVNKNGEDEEGIEPKEIYIN